MNNDYHAAKLAAFGRIAMVMRDLVNGVISVPYLTTPDTHELLAEAEWNRDYHQTELNIKQTTAREAAEFAEWKALKESSVSHG